MKKPEIQQFHLFGEQHEEDSEWWEEEWQGMPEFVQEDLSPYKTIMVHFESEEAVKSFAKLVDQKLTVQTKSIWYPKVERENLLIRKCVDESSVSSVCYQ